jgi:hypothetical protein
LTSNQPDSCDTFHLAPVPWSIDASESAQFTDSLTSSDGLNVSDVFEDLKIHAVQYHYSRGEEQGSAQRLARQLQRQSLGHLMELFNYCRCQLHALVRQQNGTLNPDW